MASRIAITLVDVDNVLQFFGAKLNTLIENFKSNEVWLEEIQEEARKMFVSDFNAEPELMPKTPSERKRLRRRPSLAQDPNKRFSRSRKSFRRSSIQRPKRINQIFVEDNSDCNRIVEQTHPVRLTRLASRAAAAATVSLETEKIGVCPIVPVNDRVPFVELSLNDCKSAELQKSHMGNLYQTLTFDDVKLLQKAVEVKPPPPNGPALETMTPADPAVNTSSRDHETPKLKTDVTKENAVCEEAGSANCEMSNASSAGGGSIPREDENKPVRNGTNRRSVRKSITGRRSSCVRLMDKYSLNVQRATMVQESTRKSLRKSIARRKNMLESSPSSYYSTIQKVVENAEKERVDVIELEQPKQNQPATMVPENQDSNFDDLNPGKQRLGCEDSCKRRLEGMLNHSGILICDDSPPKKKTPSPLCPSSKEKEKICLENLKKKQEQEEERIRRVEEEKKHKLKELKNKREMRLKRVLETRSKVEQQEEEKRKRKIDQKNSQIDEKNEKMREERIAEDKAKKKVAAKRTEEAEARRLQEEAARKQKLQQLEDERLELQQRKKEEELERQRKMAEARKLQERRQAELERERLRELQLAADRERERKQEQENIQAEKECERLEQEKALQLQRELERTAREDAALQAQRGKEKFNEAQGKEKKGEEQQFPELKSQSLENEKTTKQKLEHANKNRLCGDQQRKCKEEQDKKVKDEISNKNILNVTVEMHHSPVLESYTMTPNSYFKIKFPQFNLESYGMDLQSDDSTDDEGAPRKPIPIWANGKQLQQALVEQYYHPLDVDQFFGDIQPPNLENIFGKSKPRYLKRTSSAVWQSPPVLSSIKNVPYGLMKY
ncbi:inner centromere protein-like isoform X2 [Scyliorhinus canicula]|uniref:inner centromere protein-like isoform X2 n=1 Tax=Scyliorhinus canicula TaxID=7830 RepID=UPI0018F479BE|nr:inner centromere protein-like isoform X2 [Scyliorhinus canicula]